MQWQTSIFRRSEWLGMLLYSFCRALGTAQLTGSVINLMWALEGENRYRTLRAKQDLQPHSSSTVVTALVFNSWSEGSLCWLGFWNKDQFSHTAPGKRGSREEGWLQHISINRVTFPCWHEGRMWNAAGSSFLAVQHFGLVLQYTLGWFWLDGLTTMWHFWEGFAICCLFSDPCSVLWMMRDLGCSELLIINKIDIELSVNLANSSFYLSVSQGSYF